MMELNLKHCFCLGGKINNEAFFSDFVERFSKVMESTEPGDEIVLMINSSGGDTHTAIGVYDLIADSDRRFVGVVVGRAESAAALILQACDLRLITRNSRFTIHRTRIGIGNVTIDEAESALNSYQEMDDIMYRIMEQRTKNSIEEIQEWQEKAGYFNGEEALRHNFVDGIYGADED